MDIHYRFNCKLCPCGNVTVVPYSGDPMAHWEWLGVLWSPCSSPFFFLLGVRRVSESCSVMFNSLRPHGLYSPWNSPGQNTGVGSRFLLQGIFPTQGSNPGLPHCRQILYQLNFQRRPRILEWVAYPFSSGASWHRNWTGVPCIAGGFFTSWATRKALVSAYFSLNQLHRAHS